MYNTMRKDEAKAGTLATKLAGAKQSDLDLERGHGEAVKAI